MLGARSGLESTADGVSLAERCPGLADAHLPGEAVQFPTKRQRLDFPQKLSPREIVPTGDYRCNGDPHASTGTTM